MNSEREIYEQLKQMAINEAVSGFGKESIARNVGMHIDKIIDLALTLSTQRQGYKLVPVEVLERAISHISIAMCHPNNTRNEEDIMHNDMVIIEKAMIGAVDE